MRVQTILVSLILVSAATAAAQQSTPTTGAPRQSAPTVPSVIGMDVESARRALAARADLKSTVRQRSASGVREGTVIDQNPRGGSPIPRSRTVDLTVASGHETSSDGPRVRAVDVIVPIVGILLDRVRRPRPDTTRTPPPQPTVTDQPTETTTDPTAPPTEATPTPTLPVTPAPPPETSAGAPPDVVRPDREAPRAPAATPAAPVIASVVVPSLVRRPISTAAMMITTAGLTSDPREIARDSAGGFVLGQNPEAGVTVPAGSLVTLVRGVRVPMVEGMALDSARMLVRAAQLAVSPAAAVAAASSAVLTQRPAAGEIVSPGTVVELDSVPPRPPRRPTNLVVPLAILLLVVVAAGTMMRRQRAPKSVRTPVVRPEAHRDWGSHRITSERDLVGKTEIRLAVRSGSRRSSVKEHNDA